VHFGYAVPALRLPFDFAQGERSGAAKSKGSGRGVELPPNKNEKLSLFALRTGRFCDIVVQGGVSDKTGSSMNNNLIG